MLILPGRRGLLGANWCREALWRRAGAVPSLHLAPGRTGNAIDLIAGTVLGGGSVNSATPAWDVGPGGIVFQPAANSAVVGYDLTTLQPRGLRGWSAIVNRSLATRDLTQAVWVKSGITPTRDQVGADGTANMATRLTATASDGTCLQTLTSASTTHVSGFFVRRITGTGTVQITQNGGTTWTTITPTSTFQRFEVAAATITNPQIGFRLRSNGDEIAVDFTQCQSASVLGPPLPNASTTLTASSTADVISITGADFTRIWNPLQGTMFFDSSFVQTGGGNYPRLIAAVGANPGADEISIYTRNGIGSGDGRFFGNSCVGGTDVFTLGDPTSATINSGKAAFAFASNDAAMHDGSVLTIDNTGSIPTVSELRIMGQARYQPQPSGYIRELVIFRSRIANANLQAMTL